MAATAEQIRWLRRMIAESTDATYYDSTLSEYIERYPLLDAQGEEPYIWNSATTTYDDNDDWVATYDLNAAAADIWEEKAAAVAGDYAFSSDGGSFQRNQVYEQYMRTAGRYRSRRSMTTITAKKYPEETSGLVPSWLGNGPEIS